MKIDLNLFELGFSSDFNTFHDVEIEKGFKIGRVITEHKDRYIVHSDSGEFSAEITGNLRYSAQERSNLPAVGDWVSFTPSNDHSAIIQSISPRKSELQRQAIGKQTGKQIIATNVDTAFIVQAADTNFNINRLERYLNICSVSDVHPVFIITKTDLLTEPELQTLLEEVTMQHKNLETMAISNITGKGYQELKAILEINKTYCFIGSSGVGKSTILNTLSGTKLMKTKEISDFTQKGKHTTTHRELFVIPELGIFIDTPGMRELGITEESKSIETIFQSITELSVKCKFSNCTHTNEPNCAIIVAIQSGELSQNTLDNYIKMKKEQMHFQETLVERRKRDKKFGKMIKGVMKEKKKRK